MDINWFPGHMAKTLRDLEAALKRVEFVLETCDARLPSSSRNPEFERLLRQKPRLILLNKADLADPQVTAQWLRRFAEQSLPSLAIDGRSARGRKQIRDELLHLNREIIARARSRGRLIRPVRVMVVGIPNSGKSTVINALVGRRSAQTANKPGVTRRIQWLRAGTDFELLDTPGVLWPRLETADEQLFLAATGAIRDEILPQEAVAQGLFNKLAVGYPQLLGRRYRLEPEQLKQLTDADDLILAFEEAARLSGCLKGGGEVDPARFARRLIDDFRSGRIGRISLEAPEA